MGQAQRPQRCSGGSCGSGVGRCLYSSKQLRKGVQPVKEASFYEGCAINKIHGPGEGKNPRDCGCAASLRDGMAAEGVGT